MDRFAVKSRRAITLACWLACALSFAPVGLAGEAGWHGMMRDAGVVVDHQPYNEGGRASDTLLQESEFLPPIWQLVADDVMLAEPAVIRRIVFWGFYHFDSLPKEDEIFRIRLYDARLGDGLPGIVLYETFLANPTRNFTGRFIATSGGPAEFRFMSDLTMPMLLDAQTPYWLEVAQDGILESHFRWEVSISGDLNQAFINPFVDDWTPAPGDTAYQLIAIPEPQSFLLFLFGIAICWRRRRG